MIPAIQTIPDPDMEPGHQWIVLPDDEIGFALARVLLGGETGRAFRTMNDTLKVPHAADVDARIVELINALAHVRFSAPGLVQLTLTESVE